MPISPEQMRDAVDRYFAARTNLDPSAYAACFADDATVHDPYGSTPLRGTQALREFFAGIVDALREVRIQADSVYVAGNRSAVVFRGTGTGKNGKPVLVAGVDVFEFTAAARISGLWAYWDCAAVLAQLRH
jgi:steroid delta-isomerase